MGKLVEIYRIYEIYIDILGDLVFLIGLLFSLFAAKKILFAFINWNFNRKCKEIQTDIDKRNNLESDLKEYVIEKHQLDKKDICIRFIYWKNYPYTLEKDAFPHPLYIHQADKRTIPNGWINKTGINFVEHLWYYGTSVYFDSNGIYFFDKKNKNYKGFEEASNVVLVQQMPFSNIVNFDFKEFIEYEPIFYIRYPYTKYTKLYSPNIKIKNREDNPFYLKNLNSKYQITSPNSLKHFYFLITIKLNKKIKHYLNKEEN